VVDVLNAEYQDGRRRFSSSNAEQAVGLPVAGSAAEGLSAGTESRWHRLALGSVLVIALGLWAVRAFSPSDLADNHQNAPTAYVLDIVYGHHWWCQRDERGAIASKPPLFNWMAALSAKAFGQVSHFTLSIPSALATIALALVIFFLTEEHFGWRAGLLAGA